MRTKKSEKNIVNDIVDVMGKSVQKEVINALTKEISEIDNDIIDQKLGAFEILPGMTVEEMTAMFFNTDALIEPLYKVWQLNSKGHRYYYRYDESGNPEFYPSVTTVLSQTMPKSDHLIKWIANKGIDEAERYRDERASYGTFMHAAFEELLINRSYDLDSLKSKLKDYIDCNRLPDDFIYNADELKKDILAFAQFVIDYDVKPLAIEIALVHPHYRYAGMIDLPCTMLDSFKGSNRINAIVDFKSGRKGFYEDNELQLGMYRDMWNVNYEDFPITRIFNFSPKDWRKKPNYNLKDQSTSPNLAKIPYLLELAAIEDSKKDNVFTAVRGSINLDMTTDLSQNVISLTLSELVKTKAPKKPEKKNIDIDDLKKEAKEEKKQEVKPKNRTVRKTKNETPSVNRGAKRSKKNTDTQKIQKVSKIELKEPEKESKKNLLNDIDI